MSASKSEKRINSMEKMSKKQRVEKITNDLLLQFAYTLTVFVLTIFMFNTIAQFRYGHTGYLAARGFMWVLFGVSIVVGILFVCLYNNKKDKIGYKTTAIYSFVTAVVAFWFVGAEQIPFYLQKLLPFMSNVIGKFTGTYKVIFAMFPILAVAVIVEFIVYFVRYYSVNNKNK